ncbi:hypothetical protein [Nautilia sp. PV-1]|uniref:hypothetical protein n=1 Tax=Nautilia sp. PV-1 TaxID=2579250 RepID=UPI000FDC3283|nr:hypothetical protein [Nautilia sp. PV-1]
MLIITKNGQITAIDKELLKLLNTDLSSVSEMVNTLNLELSSIQSEPLNLNGHLFKVKEIDLLTVDDIKTFDLSVSEELSETAFTEITESSPSLSETYEEPEETHFEPKILEEQHLEPAFEPKIEQKEEPEVFEEKSEDFLVIPEEKPENKEEENVLDIGLINIPEEKTPEPEEEKENKDKLINIEEEKIEFEIPHEEIAKTSESELSVPEDGIIEISFEDDLEEIRNILNMNKEEFNKAIISELKKASEELGLDYNELLNWHDQLIEQIKEEKKDIYKFMEKKDYTNLHESYHKLKGAALNLRLSQIALVLKKLDELSKAHEDIEKIKAITDDFYKLIENESVNLAEQQAEEKEENKQDSTDVQADKFVENIILKTIQTYLNTQNEAQFQKDKKYIEKLLNTKIDSIEDLEKIVKGM